MIINLAFGILIVFSTSASIDSIPTSPCPMNFHYEFNGEHWLAVAKVFPQIYNRFRTNKITLNLSLIVNRLIPNIGNFRLLELYKSLSDTYQDIAARRPIMYRVNFPFDNEFPALLKMQVNGIQVCNNHLVLYIVSKIDLQYTFYLPTFETKDEQEDDPFQMNINRPDQITTDTFPLPDAPKVILQRVDEDSGEKVNHLKNHFKSTNVQCGTFDGELKYTQLISGGEKIVPGTWPWLVAIFRKGSKASNLLFQCTGNLITNRLVVTAAHCFKMDFRLEVVSAKEIVLAFGRNDIRDWTESNTVLSDVEEIVIHPDYLKDKQANFFDADIALMVTKNFINYNAMIRPICLWPASATSISIAGTNGTVVGWGQPDENSETNTPRRLTLPVVRNQKCFPSEKPPGQKRRVFCAGTEKRSNTPCNGDSGSAFAIWVNGAWYLRGLVSAALGDPILNRCELNTFAIFTDVSHFRKWIADFMEI